MEYLEIDWRPPGEEREEREERLDGALAQVARIKELMEGAATYPVLSGGSALIAGAIALAACAATCAVLPEPLAMARADGAALGTLAAIWGAAFVVSAAVEVALTKRAARGTRARSFYFPAGSPLLRRMRTAYTAPLLVGALLTGALVRADAYGAIPAAWILSYGAALLCAGLFSTQPVRALGAAFLALGAAAAAAPAWNLAWLAASFGLAHIAYGAALLRGGEEYER